MHKILAVLAATCLLLLAPVAADAAELKETIAALKQGGHVIVFRHGATDNSQQDVAPLDFADMSKQRQLSDKGRQAAREIGEAIKALGIPVGEVYTSRLNRAVETGKLMSGKDVTPVKELTDSGGGIASAMSRLGGGGDAELGRALRQLANTAPKAGTNTILITHKTNIGDAFGRDWDNVQEGEASVFKPGAAGAPVLVARVKATEWTSLPHD
jgi:broad specificity phosphatase PhoE